jgi:hypothetical protein
VLSRAALLAALPPEPERAPAPVLPEGPTNEAAGATILAALGDAPPDGSRSEAALALSGLLRRLGASRATFATVIRAWFAGASNNIEDHVRRGSTAWEHPQDAVSGYERLAEVLGEGRASLVSAIAGAALRPRAHAPDLDAVSVSEPQEDGIGCLGALVDPSDESDRELPYICRALGLMPYRGKVTWFAGLPGAAKGPTADHVALCVATGRPIFGAYEVERPCPVLVLDFEGAVGTKRRLRRLALDAGVEWPADLHVIEADPLAVDSGQWLEDLQGFVSANEIGMVVVDSYTSAALASGANTDKPEFARLAQRLATLGVCVICVAHAAKSSRDKDALSLADVAGSVAITAMGVCVWGFREVDKYRTEISCLRIFEGGKFEPIDILWSDTHEGAGLRVATSTRAEPVSRQAKAKAERAREKNAQTLDLRARVREWVLSHPHEAWTIRALENVIVGTRADIKAVCIDLAAKGELGTENHGTNTNPQIAYTPPREAEPAAVSMFRGG